MHWYFRCYNKNTCKMRFTIKQANCSGERIGRLSGFVKSTSDEIETPTAALLTQGGSVVNLTAEVLVKVFSKPQLLWVPLSNSVQLEEGVKIQGEGVAKFAGLPEHITCTTLNNINEMTPLGHFEKDKVPLWTKNGKKMITADRYMDVMEVFKPDIILAIADGRTSLNDGQKRISKSVDRSSSMLERCVERFRTSKQLQESSFIGVVVGASDSKKCGEIIERILKHEDILSGIALSGITDGTDDSYNIPIEKLEDIFMRVGNSLPKDLIRIIEGCWSPEIIVAAIENGWDIFDGSYPVKLTNAGKALALNFNVDNTVSEELCILDLIDTGYKDDFRPVVTGCECLTCKKHTRAYIQHLLNTREMLASVLLTIHNLHHFDQLFHHARHHIASKTYSVYKRHITKQYEIYKSTKFCNKTKATSEDEALQTNKKIKVSEETSANNIVNGSV